MKSRSDYRPRLVFLFSLFIVSVSGQFDHTMRLDSVIGSPKANLDVIDWIAGSWEGEAFGAKAEEVWTYPSGTSMMGMFKLFDSTEVAFYELMTIRQVGPTLLLQIKHFGEDLKGWEEKDETVDFKLAKVESHAVYFDGLTFEKKSDTAINVYVVISHKDGTSTEEKFEYRRMVR